MNNDKLKEKAEKLYPRIPKLHETVHSWSRNLAKQMYGKPSMGSVEKSKRRNNSKLKALEKYKN